MLDNVAQEMVTDCENMRAMMTQRRSTLEAQNDAADYKSRIIDDLFNFKRENGLLDTVRELETSNPALYKYIRKLEIVNTNIWCTTCDRQKSTDERPDDAYMREPSEMEKAIAAAVAASNAKLANKNVKNVDNVDAGDDTTDTDSTESDNDWDKFDKMAAADTAAVDDTEHNSFIDEYLSSIGAMGASNNTKRQGAPLSCPSAAKPAAMPTTKGATTDSQLSTRMDTLEKRVNDLFAQMNHLVGAVEHAINILEAPGEYQTPMSESTLFETGANMSAADFGF